MFCRSGFCCTLSHGLRGWARRRRSRRGSGWGWSRRWLSGRGLQRHRRRRIPWSIVERNIVAPRQLQWWAVRGRGSIWFHPSEVYASSLEVQKKLLFTKSRCFDSSAARQRDYKQRGQAALRDLHPVPFTGSSTWRSDHAVLKVSTTNQCFPWVSELLPTENSLGLV